MVVLSLGKLYVSVPTHPSPSGGSTWRDTHSANRSQTEGGYLRAVSGMTAINTGVILQVLRLAHL